MLRSSADDSGRVRLSVLNLVAACIDDADAELAAAVLSAIGTRHPARAIVVRADPDSAEASIEADVSLQRTSAGDHEVYTEVIRLTVTGEPAFHLASVVTPLLVPDIPIDLWVVGAPRLVQAFSDDAIALTDRIILDSGAYPDPAQPLGVIAAEFSRRGQSLMVGDIAWERTRAWREVIAQAFDAPSKLRALSEIHEVRIDSTGDHTPAQAWLVAGWLAAQLRWPEHEEPLSFHVSGHGSEAALCNVTFRFGAGASGSTLSIESSDSVLRVTSDAEGATLTRVLAHETPDILALLSRLLDESREDRIYPRSVIRAAALSA